MPLSGGSQVNRQSRATARASSLPHCYTWQFSPNNHYDFEMPRIRASSKRDQISRLSKNETALRAQMRAEKQELRRRIERDPQLKKDFDFLIEKTGLQPHQLVTGLWLDCNLIRADRQTLLSNTKNEMWPISEDDLRRTVKNIRTIARQIEAADKTDLSPLRTEKIANNFVGLPKILRAYATELQRKVDIWTPYWEPKRSRIPGLVALTRQNSVYERIRSSAGRYHQTRLLRLVNVARDVKGYPKIQQRAFAAWLNRFEKRRKQYEHK